MTLKVAHQHRLIRNALSKPCETEEPQKPEILLLPKELLLNIIHKAMLPPNGVSPFTLRLVSWDFRALTDRQYALIWNQLPFVPAGPFNLPSRAERIALFGHTNGALNTLKILHELNKPAIKNSKALAAAQENVESKVRKEFWEKADPDDREPLRALRLSVSRTDLELLSTDVALFKNVTKLDLSHNRLKTLCPEIGSLVRLNKLYLSGNDLEELPKTIGQLTELKRLFAYCNKLTYLPDEIGRLGNLESCYLFRNQLQRTPRYH